MADVISQSPPSTSTTRVDSAEGRIALSPPSSTDVSVNVRRPVSDEDSSSGSVRQLSLVGCIPMSPTVIKSLTPAQMRPVCSAVKQWRRHHEDSMLTKLMEIKTENKINLHASKENARKLARKIPIEILAKDWLQENNATVDVRAYLVDKVFPTLILGVEKLLEEADRRGLAEVDVMDPNFNPLNFLAQYLLRNNPKYSNFSEASPYIRGLRQVGEDLRQQLFEIEGNRLARIKAEAKRKREVREAREMVQRLEKERRQDSFEKQFEEWKTRADGKVELALLQNTLRSFAELAEQYPEELRNSARFKLALDSTDESGLLVNVREFAQYLTKYTEEFPAEIFDEFIGHLSKCAHANCMAVEQEGRRIVLTNLFMACDHSGVGPNSVAIDTLQGSIEPDDTTRASIDLEDTTQGSIDPEDATRASIDLEDTTQGSMEDIPQGSFEPLSE